VLTVNLHLLWMDAQTAILAFGKGTLTQLLHSVVNSLLRPCDDDTVLRGAEDVRMRLVLKPRTVRGFSRPNREVDFPFRREADPVALVPVGDLESHASMV
jgi:hypothetical protein